MPIITEVCFAHPNGALADTLSQLPDFTVSVIQESSTDPERDRYFMRFDGGQGPEIDDILAADSTVRSVEPLSGFEDQLVWGVTFARSTELMAPRVTDEDGFVLEARSTPSVAGGLPGWRERWLLPDREALHAIWEGAGEDGFEFEVLNFHRQGGAEGEYDAMTELTDKQREALVAAYEQGYFADPRQTSLAELAETLDLSPTAVADRIRRGMKATIEMTYLSERPE